MQGRNETLNAIVKGQPIPRPGTPESFKVLMRELQALCLDIAAYTVSDTGIDSFENEINLMTEFKGSIETRTLNSNTVIN
jgi:DNA-directed RNA polymerase subunit beta